MGRKADTSNLPFYYEIILNNPGITYIQLGKLLDKSYTSVESMLSTMELFGYLVSEDEGRIHAFMTQYAGRIKKSLSRTQHSTYAQILQVENGITLTFTDLGDMRCHIKLAKSSSRIVSQDSRYNDITEQQLQTIFNAISQAGGSDYVKDEADTKDITYTFAMKPIERIYN